MRQKSGGAALESLSEVTLGGLGIMENRMETTSVY